MKVNIIIKKTRVSIAPRAVFIFWITIGIIAYFVINSFLPKGLLTVKNVQEPSVSKINTDVVYPIGKSEMEKLKEQYKNKFVLIFFYDGYTSQAQALAHISVLKATLKIIEPFKSMSDIVDYKVFTTDSQKCRVKETGNVKVLICDKKLIDSFRQLGIDHFKLVILSPLDFSSTALLSRGNNSWITLSTYNDNLPQDKYNRLLGLEFAQNLGVSLGLSQEGTQKRNADKGSVGHAPNCAENEITARSWWGGYTALFKEVGYFKGCAGNSSFIYPEEGTLMSQNPKKESYGRVSEDYLRGVLSCFYKGDEKIIQSKTATHSAAFSSCTQFKNNYSLFWDQ